MLGLGDCAKRGKSKRFWGRQPRPSPGNLRDSCRCTCRRLLLVLVCARVCASVRASVRQCAQSASVPVSCLLLAATYSRYCVRNMYVVAFFFPHTNDASAQKVEGTGRRKRWGRWHWDKGFLINRIGSFFWRGHKTTVPRYLGTHSTPWACVCVQ